MKIHDIQMNHINKEIIVLYYNNYDYDYMIEQVKKVYPDCKCHVLEHEQPSIYKNFKNYGTIILQ